MNIVIEIDKSEVIAEVQKTTAYEGAHSGAFDNTYVKTQDETMLERYWDEAISALTDLVKDFISGFPSTTGGDYSVQLSMPASFDSNLEDSINVSSTNYCTNYMIAKWLEMLGIDKAGKYGEAAISQLGDVRNKIYYRKKPSRN